MSDRSEKDNRVPGQKRVIERSYRASLEEVWELWTSKDGFESWWGPQGFRVEVHTIEARVGGTLHYDMIAEAPEHIEALKKLGRPSAHESRGRFVELVPRARLAVTFVIDFFPDVEPYESTMLVELLASGPSVRMKVTLDPMHDEQFSQMQAEGFASQLTKLDERFGS